MTNQTAKLEDDRPPDLNAPDPDDHAPRMARHIAMLERMNEFAVAAAERANAAGEAEAKQGRYDAHAEELRSRTCERACRTLRRNMALIDRFSLDKVAIGG